MPAPRRPKCCDPYSTGCTADGVVEVPSEAPDRGGGARNVPGIRRVVMWMCRDCTDRVIDSMANAVRRSES